MDRDLMARGVASRNATEINDIEVVLVDKADIEYVDAQLQTQLEQTSITWYWTSGISPSIFSETLPSTNLSTTLQITNSNQDYTKRFQDDALTDGLWSPRSVYKLYLPMSGFQTNTNYVITIRYSILSIPLREVVINRTGSQLIASSGIQQDINVLVRNTPLEYAIGENAFVDITIRRTNGFNHTLTMTSTPLNPAVYTRTGGAVSSNDVYQIDNGIVKSQASINLLFSERVRSGNGSPESVVIAPTGTLYCRLDGGTNTTLYVKETGIGNTGWVAK